jgi:hypothetical protein
MIMSREAWMEIYDNNLVTDIKWNMNPNMQPMYYSGYKYPLMMQSGPPELEIDITIKAFGSNLERFYAVSRDNDFIGDYED